MTDSELGLEAILSFINNPTQKEFILNGAAGTGKTTLVKEIYNHPEIKKKFDNIYITALTNKAVAIYEDISKAQTIHKLLNLKLQRKEDNYYLSSKNRREEIYITNSLVIIDEYSMMCNNVLSYIHKKLVNCKIIFVGDPYQLNPVSNSINKDYWKQLPSFTLTEIKRTTEPKMKELYLSIQDSVINKHKFDIDNKSIYKSNLIEKISKNTAIDIIKNSSFGEYYFIAYTNHECNRITEYLKSIYNIKDILPKGTLVRTVNPYKYGNNYFYGDQLLTIDKVTLKEDTYKHPKNNKEYILKYKNYTFEDEKVFKEAVDIKDINPILKYYKDNKEWNNYYNIIDRYGNLRLEWINTIHKSQGSSYNNVMVFTTGLSHIIDIDTYNRLLYVAFSRTRNKLYIVS